MTAKPRLDCNRYNHAAHSITCGPWGLLAFLIVTLDWVRGIWTGLVDTLRTGDLISVVGAGKQVTRAFGMHVGRISCQLRKRRCTVPLKTVFKSKPFAGWLVHMKVGVGTPDYLRPGSSDTCLWCSLTVSSVSLVREWQIEYLFPESVLQSKSALKFLALLSVFGCNPGRTS